ETAEQGRGRDAAAADPAGNVGAHRADAGHAAEGGGARTADGGGRAAAPDGESRCAPARRRRQLRSWVPDPSRACAWWERTPARGCARAGDPLEARARSSAGSESVDSRSLVASRQLPVASFQLPASRSEFPIPSSCWKPEAGNWTLIRQGTPLAGSCLHADGRLGNPRRSRYRWRKLR